MTLKTRVKASYTLHFKIHNNRNTIFHNITVFWSNKCILGEHKRLFITIKKILPVAYGYKPEKSIKALLPWLSYQFQPLAKIINNSPQFTWHSSPFPIAPSAPLLYLYCMLLPIIILHPQGKRKKGSQTKSQKAKMRQKEARRRARGGGESAKHIRLHSASV